MVSFTRTRGSAQVIAAGVAIAALSAGVPAIAAGVKVKQALSATSADPDARGQARFTLKGFDNGKLVIRASRLIQDASFDVLANGVKIGTIATSGGGGGRIRLRSRPSSNDALLGFDPRGANIVVRSSSGEDVLAGTVPDDSIEPGKIACCIPEDSGAECEDRTEAECLAEGGTVTTSNTCLPDPCEAAGAPPPETDGVVCCIPDDDGPECEDRTEAACATEGGVVVQGTSCDASPCAATPPAEGEIACCVPHGTEPAECEMETSATCTALGGTATDAASCSPDPCGGGAGEPGDDNGGNGGDDPPGDDNGGDSGHGGGND